MINVIIADNQSIFRAGAAKILAVEEDLRIVGQPQSAEQLLNALDKLRSHVLLFSSSYLQHFAQILEIANRRSVRLLILAENGQPASQYTQMGIPGVIYRSVAGATVVEAVRRLAQGCQFVQPLVPSNASPNEDFVGTRVRDRLSSKELRVVAALVRGYKNREIAELIGTSEQVIKNTLRAVYDKIGVSDRLELALFVLHHETLAQAAAMVHFHHVSPTPVGPLPTSRWH